MKKVHSVPQTPFGILYMYHSYGFPSTSDWYKASFIQVSNWDFNKLFLISFQNLASPGNTVPNIPLIDNYKLSESKQGQEREILLANFQLVFKSMSSSITRPCEKNTEYQPCGGGGTRSPPATPHRLQNPNGHQGPQNGRRGLERYLPLGFWALLSTFPFADRLERRLLVPILRVTTSYRKGKSVVKKIPVFLWSLQTDIHTQIAGKIIF